MQQCNRVNKSFEKIPRFDGSTPHYCFDWLEQTEALSNRYPDRNYKEELLFNCGNSVSKTIHAVPEGATNQQIKDAVLHNHSNLRTLSQRSNAYQNMYQKPDEALQTYNIDTHHTSDLLTQNWTRTYLKLFMQLLRKWQISNLTSSQSKAFMKERFTKSTK